MDFVHLIIGFGYLGIAATVFAESGLFIGFFLPGDSLLFTAGFLASQDIFDIRVLAALCAVAAIAGDSVGYAFGRRVGPKLFTRSDSLIFHRDHLTRAQRFFARYGAKAVVLARFMPIVRTFTPVLAGVGNMQYRTFLAYNVIGGCAWAIGIPLAGYWLGRSIPNVDRYLFPIILGIIIASVMPGIVHLLRDHRSRAQLVVIIRSVVQRLTSFRRIR